MFQEFRNKNITPFKDIKYEKKLKINIFLLVCLKRGYVQRLVKQNTKRSISEDRIQNQIYCFNQKKEIVVKKKISSF